MWSDQPDLSGLHALHRQADELARTLAAGSAATRAEFTGGDGAGVVEVTIDASGAPARVRLARDWRQSVGVSGLGPAVLAALSAATTQRLTVWAAGVAGGVDEPPPDGPRPAGPASTRTGEGDAPGGAGGRVELGDPTSRQSIHALRDLMDLVTDVTDRLGELAGAATTAAEGEVTATDAGRTVRVTATGGTVTAVEFDDHWLRTADHQRVADAIGAALAASTEAAARARQELLDSVPGMERIRQLTASPETLFREIGLIR